MVAGVLRGECERRNEVFFHFMRTKLPFTVLKYAMTLDGKTATVSGKSQWITGEAARKRVHEDRGRYMAILTGVSTVLADNPQLTCRIPGGKNPIRVIADTKLRTPLSSTVVQTARETPTWIVTAVSDAGRKKAYEDAGCRVLSVPAKEGELDLQAMMQRLGRGESGQRDGRERRDAGLIVFKGRACEPGAGVHCSEDFRRCRRPRPR